MAADVAPLPADPVAPRVVVPGACQDPAKAAQNANVGCLGHPRTPSNPQAVVVLSPKQQIAQVGSEVILLGGVCGGDGYYRRREPLEWAISEGGVGHFVEPGQSFVGQLGLRGRMSGLFAEPLPELFSNNYAVACASNKVQVLTRGTVATTDDVFVESGQVWIGVTAPREGATYVTLMAPDLDGWEQRRQTAVIHWVDGQWTLPPSAIVRGIQPHVLTTTVNRRLNNNPIGGWIVRYAVLDATATFSNGSTEQEVTTDANGQASVQVLPALPAGGSVRVQVQVIRPARGSEPDRLVIGEGTSTVTWTTAQLNVRVQGPASVKLNEAATYRIEVSNPGSLAASDVLVRAMIPGGFELTSSSPSAQPFGSRLDWPLGQIGPGEQRVLEVSYRAAQSGTARHCVQRSGRGGTAN